MSLADQIINQGPYRDGDSLPIEVQVADSAEVNELRDELMAARALKELLASGRFLVYAAASGDAQIGLTHDGCPGRWWVDLGDFTALAELVQRAAEHAEVCR